MSAYDQGEQCPLIVPLLPWRESEDLPRIEHRREPPGGDMQRRGSSGQSVKGQRQRTKPTTRKAPTAHVSADHSTEHFDCLKRERDEAREQQAATAEVLKVISRSTFDLQTVFDTIVVNAVRLCHAHMGAVHRFDGKLIHIVAHHNFPPEAVEVLQRLYPRAPQPDQASGRAILSREVAEIEDMLADRQYTREVTVAGQWGSILAVPMLRDGVPIGAIVITRNEVGRFAARHIDLLKTFADQAVIAIENARLFNETKEALEQQTATSEILKVISSSPGELEPVFETMLENAVRICGAKFGNLWLREGTGMRIGATHGAPHAYVDFVRGLRVFQPDPRVGLGTIIRTKEPFQTEDVAAVPTHGDKTRQALVELAGARTLIAVPMLKDDEVVGAIGIYRQEVRPFTDKQIELLKNFAAQAVIAIENTRLLNELRQRTDDLSESLQQQTATADILKVISSSPGDLKPVFGSVLENATRLCDAKFGTLFLHDGESFRFAADVGAPREYTEFQSRRGPFKTNPGTQLGQVLHTKRVTHTADYSTEPLIGPSAKVAGARSSVSVPMLKDEEFVGAIQIFRLEVRPFTDKQIALLENFAAQAVIAIENARLLNELRESLQQQTATADVLKVISSSPTDVQPVLDSILQTAGRLCEAEFACFFRLQDGKYHLAGSNNARADYIKYLSEHPIGADRGTVVGRAAVERRTVHIPDCLADPEYTAHENARIGKHRSLLGVPLLRDGIPVGVIGLLRTSVKPYTDKQVELVETFADQAVIALENTRLLNELRESLQQQTATADVLKVISRSTFDLQKVLDTLTESAAHLCEADMAGIARQRQDSPAFHHVTNYNFPPDWVEYNKALYVEPGRGSVIGRVLLHRKVVQVPDVLADPEYTYFDTQKKAGFRTFLGVPLLREGNPIGVIMLGRKTVAPFTEKQIDLVTTFADQAVIAIENVRLFDEVQARTRELSESLEQQTATSEVLHVISSSPGELKPVFDALLANAVRICDAKFGVLFLTEGDAFRYAALYGAPPAFAEARRREPVTRVKPGTTVGRVAATKKPAQTADIRAEPAYTSDPERIPILELAGARTILSVPMLRDDDLVGQIVIYRQEVRPFSDKQIELLSNFAAQAVIAIENTRLLNELRESLQQQTATAEVLKVISSSPGELAPVFEAILGNATRICEAKFGTLTQVLDGIPSLMFQLGVPSPLEEYWRRESPRPSPHNAISRVITTGQAVHVKDLQAYQAYIDGDPLAVAGVELGGIRTLLVVPMLKDEKTFGTIGIYRQEVRPFTDKQVELVSNFAAQAAIAIENTRLLNELRQRTDDLSKSLENLRATQDRLVQTQKLASLGQLTAGIAHEIKNPLNFVNNFSGVSSELIDELQDALSGLSIDQKARTEINELTDTLRGNLQKVVQHGKRADAIVKNMLLHSREGSGEHRVVDINALVEESLNLAYHGARAEKQGFNITMERSLDPAAGQADVFPQDITRALLNLISNGFYAAIRRRAAGNGGDYEPTLAAVTKNRGDRVEITIRDNGTGIPPEVKEKMFNPFFTTKPAGEGTGLGLSICHDIIVKQHGGSIEVDTQPGEFTEIRVTLPRVAASLS
jgi:GAF domain-containing protein